MINEAQSNAIFSDDKKILCLAGAGSGKTFTLLERIKRLTALGVDPASILCLTFTNAAAFEMLNRFGDSTDCESCPEFRTFHSFCYNLITSDTAILKNLNYTSVPSVADESQIRRIEQEAMMQVGVKLSRNKLSGKIALTATEKYEYDVLMKAQNRLMHKYNVITFDRLLSEICKLFIEDSPLIKKYKDKYRYIFADEFQDTDPLQWKFIQSFSGSSLFVVGDALQALYSFRGADSTIIKAVASDPDWTVIRLTKNYRSTKQICNYANNFTKTYAADEYRIELESDELGYDVNEMKVITPPPFAGKNKVSEMALQDILKHLGNSEYAGTSAILTRTNSESEFVQNYLKAKGVSFVTNKKHVDVQNILKSCIDNGFFISWMSTFLNSAQYASYIIHSTGSEYSFDQFVEEFGFIPEISKNLEAVKNLRRILDDSDLETIEVMLKSNPEDLKTGKSEVDELLTKLQNVVPEDCNLYVGTVHSVKGLEYDNVYVVGVDSPAFLLNSEDNKNVFYVAVTRAKSRLHVYVETTIKF